MLRSVLRILNLVFLALYILSAAVQYNDPDPIRWMVIYLAAAAVCIVAMRRPVPRWASGAVALASLIWIAIWTPRVLGQVGLGEMFRERGMATMAIEEGREDIGLILVFLWMVVLFLLPDRVSRKLAPRR